MNNLRIIFIYTLLLLNIVACNKENKNSEPIKHAESDSEEQIDTPDVKPNDDESNTTSLDIPESSDTVPSAINPNIETAIIPENFVKSKNGLFYVKFTTQKNLIAGGDGENDIDLALIDSKGESLKIFKIISFHPTMPSMGHGTDESTQVYSYSEKGMARVSGIYFSMPGQANTWVVTLTLSWQEHQDTVDLFLPEVF